MLRKRAESYCFHQSEPDLKLNPTCATCITLKDVVHPNIQSSCWCHEVPSELIGVAVKLMDSRLSFNQMSYLNKVYRPYTTLRDSILPIHRGSGGDKESV